MLLDQVSRHKRLLSFAIFVFIGLPMVFFIPGAAQFTFGGESSANPPVAKVGSTPITASEFAQRYAQAQQERQRFGQPATAQDLVNDGTVDAILDNLISQALITEQTKKQPVYPDNDYLKERLKKDPYFQNEQGEFDAGLFNQWVESATRSKFDWEQMYAGLAEQINQEAYLGLIGASARVTDAEVRKHFNNLNTKLKVRAIAIAPTIELSDEDLRAYYDAHLEDFMSPEARIAEYVSISMEPPVPALAGELIEKATAGEDFAELAKAHSEALDAESGGDLGWISEAPGLREHEKVLFEMQPGEVRGPIRSFLGLHIYKVEETRTDAEGNREVHARQIVLRPELDATEDGARRDRAQAILVEASAPGSSLQAVAADEGLEVGRTPRFSERTEQIEGISESDTFIFRRDVSKLAIGQLSEVIDAGDHLYIAEVVELFPPSQQSFEEARADVEQAATQAQKESPEYQQRLGDYLTKISAEAKSIEQVQEMFPELPIEIKETDPFGADDLLFNQGLFIDTRQIFGRLLTQEPGTFTGPYFDMLRVPQFIELTERTVPEGENWETQFASEKVNLRGELIRSRQLERRMDYMQHLLAKAIDGAMVQKDYDLIFDMLGLNQKAAPASTTSDPGASQTDTQGTGADTPIVLLPEDSAATTETPVADQ